MNIGAQFCYSVKRLLKEPKPIIMKIMTYMIIILILGSAFSKAFDSTTLEKVNIAFYNEDKGNIGSRIIKIFNENDQINKLAIIDTVESLEEGKKLINNEEADALIYIPSDYSVLSEDEDATDNLDIFLQNYTGVNAMIIQSIISTTINGLNTANTVYHMNGSTERFQFDSVDSIKEMPLSKNIQPTAMAYYAMAMLLMMLFYGADYGRVGVGEDFSGVLGDRIKFSPMKPVVQYTGKILGLAMVKFIQGLVIIMFTAIVYKVDWGNEIWLLLLIIFTFSLLATIIGAMLTILTRDVDIAGSIVPLIIIGCTFLSGGFFPVDLGNAAKISPSYYAKNTLFEMIYNHNVDNALKFVGIMWIMIVVFCLISLASARRKRA